MRKGRATIERADAEAVMATIERADAEPIPITKDQTEAEERQQKEQIQKLYG